MPTVESSNASDPATNPGSHRAFLIRPELPDDEEAIARITEAAFRGHPYSRQTEHFNITHHAAFNASE